MNSLTLLKPRDIESSPNAPRVLGGGRFLLDESNATVHLNGVLLTHFYDVTASDTSEFFAARTSKPRILFADSEENHSSKPHGLSALFLSTMLVYGAATSQIYRTLESRDENDHKKLIYVYSGEPGFEEDRLTSTGWRNVCETTPSPARISLSDFSREITDGARDFTPEEAASYNAFLDDFFS